MKWPRLVGPVFFYDLLRHSRRGRYIALRCLFVIVLFILMAITYRSYADMVQQYSALQRFRQQDGTYRIAGTITLGSLDTSIFGEKFFSWYFMVQYIVIVLVTPAMVSGAITEEKQKQTIEYLFTSDITNREIVFGKLLSRVAAVIMLVLAGVPVLALVQLFGGVSWELLLAGFGACLVTILSLACLSIYQSVYARRVRESLGKVYLMMVLYFVGWALLFAFRGIMLADLPPTATPVVAMDKVLEVYNAGNPVVLLLQLRDHVTMTGSLGTKPFDLLGEYAIFHAVLSAICLLLAMVQLRRTYIRQLFVGRRKKIPSKRMAFLYKPVWGKGKSRRRPPVADRDPLSWKERWCERTIRFNPVIQAIFVVGMGLLLAPGVIGAVLAVIAMINGNGLIGGAEMGPYYRFLGAFLFGLAMMGITIRAAGSIGTEKDRQTWDALLAAPLSLRAIYWSKWWASLMAPRWFYLTWIIMMTLAACTVTLHVLSIPAALVQAMMFAMFAASLGLWFAVRCQTGLRALIGSVLVLLTLSMITLYLHFQFAARPDIRLVASRSSRGGIIYERAPVEFEVITFAPLFGIGFTLQSGYSGNGFLNEKDLDYLDERVANVMGSAFLYGGLALILYWRGYRRLARSCGRVDSSGTQLARHSPPPLVNAP